MARTLSKTAHQSIIKAFVNLMAVQPIDDITTDAIARAAGASKSTLYMHWEDKDELLIEVVSQIVAGLPAADSGDFRKDATIVLRNMFVTAKRGPFGRVWSNIFAYSVAHPKFCRAVNKQLIERAPKHTLVAIIRAASQAGILRPDLDVEFALDLLAGPLMHHRFLHGTVPFTLPETVVASIWPLLQRN